MTMVDGLRRIGATTLAAIALGACGGGAADGDSNEDGADGADGAGAGASVGSSATGFLVVVGAGPVRLCAALAESFPPQCGGDSTTVVGLDLGEIVDVESEADVRWTAAPITLAGLLDGERLTVPVEPAGPSIVGRAVAGPVCPAETDPSDPNCAARSVRDAPIVVRAGDGSVVLSVVTDATGRFAVAVPAGDYTVEPGAVDGLLGQAPPVAVTVADAPVAVELLYDTGIR